TTSGAASSGPHPGTPASIPATSTSSGRSGLCSIAHRRVAVPTGVRSLRTASAAALASTVLLATLGTAAAARPKPAQFLTWSKAHELVHLTLLAGLDSGNNGFNFDGYG